MRVNGQDNADAAWYYPCAKDERSQNIENYVAFWKGIEVTK